MVFIFWFVILPMVVSVISLWRRLDHLTAWVEDGLTPQHARMERRLAALEGLDVRLPVPATAPPLPKSFESTWPAMAAPPEPVPAPKPAPIVAERPAEPPPVLPPPLPLPLPPPPSPPVGEPDPVAQPAAPAPARNWEATFGGSWLNKLGVGLILIALALLVGYSFNRLGPEGRVATGLVLGAAMLAGGIYSERKEGYRIFGRGLIGGGWAALYFTTYAAYAVSTAKILDNPVSATVLLLGMAAGMIIHSLRYESRVATGLALFLAFLTLTISEVSTFAIVALLPLTIALVYLAGRYAWYELTVLGIPMTYGLYLYQASQTHSGSLLLGQAILLLFWFAFEALDLWQARREADSEIGVFIFPLNAAAFLLVSSLQWMSRAPADIHQFLFVAAAAYLLNTAMRATLSLPYRGAVTLMAGLLASGIMIRFDGLARAGALLLEGQALFVAGLWWRASYVRSLSAAVLALAGGDTLFELLPTVKKPSGWQPGTPLALIAAVCFFANRALHSTSKLYGHAGALMLWAVLAADLPLDQIGLGWFALAFALYEFARRSGQEDFRGQAFWTGASGLLMIYLVNVLGIGLPLKQAPFALQLAAALMLVCATARVWLTKEDNFLRDFLSWCASGVLTVWLWNVLPEPVVAIAWALLSLLLIELSYAARMPALQMQGHVGSGLVFGRLFLSNFNLLDRSYGVSLRAATVVPVIALHYYLFGRLKDQPRIRRIYLYSAGLLLAALIRFEAGRVLAVAGWALLLVALAALGRRFENRDLKWQSMALAVAAFARCWASNFTAPESLWGMPGRVMMGALVIACLYAAHWLLKDRQRIVLSLMASTLLGVLLFYEVSGSLLTVAWGVEGAALMACGFPLRDRTLRLSGLSLLALCTGKLFIYDLRNLTTPYRIASFLVLGLLLLAASWAYSRFREQFMGESR